MMVWDPGAYPNTRCLDHGAPFGGDPSSKRRSRVQPLVQGANALLQTIHGCDEFGAGGAQIQQLHRDPVHRVYWAGTGHITWL